MEKENIKDLDQQERDLEWEKFRFLNLVSQALPPDLHQIYDLRYTENLTYHSISEKLGISLSRVKNRLHTLLTKIPQCWEIYKDPLKLDSNNVYYFKKIFRDKRGIKKKKRSGRNFEEILKESLK